MTVKTVLKWLDISERNKAGTASNEYQRQKKKFLSE